MKYFAYSQKEFVYKYVVMFSDIDQFKHMSFANYLKLMFLVADALLMPCLEMDFLSRYKLKVLDSRMQFKRQTVVGDNIIIKVSSTGIEDCRFALLHTFVVEESAELIALGRQMWNVSGRGGEVLPKMPDSLLELIDPIRVDEQCLLYKY